MKLYALDFRIELRPDLPSDHFKWQRLRLADIVAQLRTPGADFVDQMFYAEATMQSLDLIKTLLEDEKVASQRATLVLMFSDPDEIPRFFDTLRESYRPETAAGGLVRNQNNELLLIHRLGRWDLPKGKVEKGESLEEAALREVAEETGLKGHVLEDHMEDTFHVFKRKKKWKFKVTHWYRMSAGKDENNTELKPQAEEGITDVKWWSEEDLATQLPSTYPLIEDLLNKYPRSKESKPIQIDPTK